MDRTSFSEPTKMSTRRKPLLQRKPLDSNLVQVIVFRVFLLTTMLLNHKLSDLDWNGSRGKQMERRELTGSFKHATILRHERQPEMTFFSFLTSLRTTTFILLRMLSKAVTTDLEIWEGILSWYAQCSDRKSVV